MADEFDGRPWNAEPTPEWNEAQYWAKYYDELRDDPDPWRLDRVVHRSMYGILRTLNEIRVLPHSAGLRKLTVLDAGCGTAIIPEVFAYWGFTVTAVDVCPNALPTGRSAPDADALARCMGIWEPAPDGRGWSLVEDPARQLAKLREYRREGGSVLRVVADWHDPQFTPASFDMIHCRNSLRLSPKRYWRKSLTRFHELLAPGGVLYVESVNAIGIQDEVEALARECGFWLPGQEGPWRDPAGGKTFRGWWPTG